MKSFVPLFFLGAAAASVSAAGLDRRGSFCGLWDKVDSGSYTLANNLWGYASGSGSECTSLDSANGKTIAWSSTWSWANNPSSVKAFANVFLKDIQQKQLSAIQSIPTTWSWSYTGDNLICDVAYDLFTTSTPGGNDEYEVMVWLGKFGQVQPIGADNKLATVKIAGKSFSLYKGMNGSMTVFSFVADATINTFTGDLMDFVDYLTANQGLNKAQYIKSIGAGTEPFIGNNAKFTTSALSLSMS